MTSRPRGFRRLAQIARAHPVGEAVRDDLRERLGRRVHAREGGLVVKVAIGELGQHLVQYVGRPTDIDDDVVGVERCASECGVHEVRGAVQTLRGPEHLAAEAVGDHHVITNGHAEHELLRVVDDRVAERGDAAGGELDITSGSSEKPDSPVTSASKAGSGSNSSAIASRSAVVRRPARAGDTVPTWLARMARRLE